MSSVEAFPTSSTNVKQLSSNLRDNGTKKKRPDSIVITPTDKSICLIAIDKTHYEDILHKSMITTNNYQKRNSKLNQPKTEEIKCNGQLNKIATKYSKKHPELCKALDLFQCIVVYQRIIKREN